MEIRANWNYKKDPQKIVLRLFWLGIIFFVFLGEYYSGLEMTVFMAFAGVFLSYLWKFSNRISAL